MSEVNNITPTTTTTTTTVKTSAETSTSTTAKFEKNAHASEHFGPKKLGEDIQLPPEVKRKRISKPEGIPNSPFFSFNKHAQDPKKQKEVIPKITTYDHICYFIYHRPAIVVPLYVATGSMISMMATNFIRNKALAGFVAVRWGQVATFSKISILAGVLYYIFSTPKLESFQKYRKLKNEMEIQNKHRNDDDDDDDFFGKT